MTLRLFTPYADWFSAPVGTLGFYRGDSIFSTEIEKLQPSIPSGPKDFIPSHVFIKFDDLHVVEAIQQGDVNSVAAIDKADVYKAAISKGDVRLLCPPGPTEIWHDSILWLINTYGDEPYGWSVIFGFLSEYWHKLGTNPSGKKGHVCSQAAWEFLNHGCGEMLKKGLSPQHLKDLLVSFPEDNCAPLNLYQTLTMAVYNC